MSTSAEPNSKQSEQSGQAMSATNDSTIDVMRRWKEVELLEWIQKTLPVPLKLKDTKRFLEAGIAGDIFFECDYDFFRNEVGFDGVAAKRLDALVKRIIGRKSECCRST